MGDNEDKEELRKQSEATKRKIAKSMTGKNNPQWKDGRRAYRRIADAKKGEGVDHIDGDSKNNSPSNLRKFKLKGPSRSAHERKHNRGENAKGDGSGRKPVKRGYVAKRMKK